MMQKMAASVRDILLAKNQPKLAEMYTRCFASTWDTTLQRLDGTVFLITGDIPAMWLRDSSAQVFHYLHHAGDYPEVAEECEYDPELVMDYFYLDGMYEGHVANAFFDPAEILRTNTELRKTLGEDWWSYYSEFTMYGWEDEWTSRIRRTYLPQVTDEP